VATPRAFQPRPPLPIYAHIMLARPRTLPTGFIAPCLPTDLIELNGDDLRRDPLEVRKATLASIVGKARPGIRFNEHIEGDGPTVFATPASSGWRASSRSASARATDPAARTTGSR